MAYPFQRLLFTSDQNANGSGSILLACGPSIFTFHASTGQYQSAWRVDDDIASNKPKHEQGEVHAAVESPLEESPNKKRKVASASTRSDASSAEIVLDHENATKRPPKKPASDLPAVINLLGSENGCHVIVATNEDKCIRVLELARDGKLSTLSQRTSAMVLSADQKTILCADKFGDVYGLPLILPEQVDSALQAQSDAPSPKLQRSSTSKPAASELTVHTQKNLNALRNQLARQAEEGGGKKQRTNEYQPILGHVSLLTDILEVSLITENGRRSYIITSDRDEHIRISRGLPQAHVIEGYCLGHSQFVTSLCAPEWDPLLLFSGGGDDFLLSWDWITSTIRQKIPLRREVDRLRKAHGKAENKPFAVSGIWAMRVDNGNRKLLVACEGVAAILTFDIDEEGNVLPSTALELKSNVLDVGVLPGGKGIFYILDNFREPYTTEIERIELNTAQFGMHRWSDDTSGWGEVFEAPVSEIQAWNLQRRLVPAGSVNANGYTQIYYALENLRKQSDPDKLESEQQL